MKKLSNGTVPLPTYIGCTGREKLVSSYLQSRVIQMQMVHLTMLIELCASMSIADPHKAKASVEM